MKVFQRIGNGVVRLAMVGVLGSMVAGCSSVQHDDPVNPKKPYVFPGQAESTVAASPVISTPAPMAHTPAPNVPAPAVTAAPAEVQPTLTPAPAQPAIPEAAPPVNSTPALPEAAVKPAEAAPGGSSPVDATGNSVVLQPGDSMIVSFSDLPSNMSLLPIQAELGADGKLTLHHNVHVYALGKTPRQLEQEIRSEYVPKFYRYLTITIKTEMRFYHVNGEVKAPSQYPWRGKTTVLRAIGAAGGFTDWAKETTVQLTRVNGQKFTINCKEAKKKPALDLPVYPGDLVDVPRKGIWGF